MLSFGMFCVLRFLDDIKILRIDNDYTDDIH